MSDLINSAVGSNPAVAAADALGSMVYYVGWAAIANGIIGGLYGLSGIAYHGKAYAESFFAAKRRGASDEDNVASERWDEVKKHFHIAAPGIALGVAGYVIRELGTKLQGEGVHNFVASLSQKT